MNTSSYSEQQRAKAKKARFENMDEGYVPVNQNPLNIEIGPAGQSHRVLQEDDDAIGDVQINDNFSMGHPSAHQSMQNQ